MREFTLAGLVDHRQRLALDDTDVEGERIEALDAAEIVAVAVLGVFAVVNTRGRPGCLSHRRHLLEFRQGRIEVIPGVAAHGVRHRLRIVPDGIVEACGVHGKQVRHRRKCQLHR